MNHSLVSVLTVVLLIVGSFALGSMYTKVQVLEGKYNVAGAQAPTIPRNSGNNAPAPTPPPAPTKANVTLSDADPMKGDPKAKVTIVEFSDFQCPFCGRFFRDTEPQVLKEYIDTGKAKFVYKNLAFLGQESKDAANAALCAKEQNKFWEYHDYLFTHQQGENQGAFSKDNLKKFAVDLGLAVAQFNSCLDANKYDTQVQADIADANKNGFNSTPSFAVNTTPLIGAQPFAQFKTAIDAELAKK